MGGDRSGDGGGGGQGRGATVLVSIKVLGETATVVAMMMAVGRAGRGSVGRVGGVGEWGGSDGNNGGWGGGVGRGATVIAMGITRVRWQAGDGSGWSMCMGKQTGCSASGN
eukprot:14434877-Alexandrium_andersonii.AAC.1